VASTDAEDDSHSGVAGVGHAAVAMTALQMTERDEIFLGEQALDVIGQGVSVRREPLECDPFGR
jgi:hypothetical protein